MGSSPWGSRVSGGAPSTCPATMSPRWRSAHPEHRRARRRSRHRSRYPLPLPREPGPLVVDGLEHAELVSTRGPSSLQDDHGPDISRVGTAMSPRNQLVLIGVILSTLSSSPLLVVTYSAPSGPVRAARSRP